MKKKELQKEFENTGYASWINSDIYPDNKIYTKAYTEWLENRLLGIINCKSIFHENDLRFRGFCETCGQKR